MAHGLPQIGEWYLDNESKAVFEVVAIDEDQNTLEIQYDSGDIDEMDLEHWTRGRFTSSCAPDDAGLTYGVGEDDQWDDAIGDDAYSDPSNRFELDQYQDFDDFM